MRTKSVDFCLAISMVTTFSLNAENVELRIATLVPSGSPSMTVLNQAANEIKEKTEGWVTIKYYEGGQQGDERDFVRKIKLGQLDGATLTAVGLAMIDESIRLFELPALFASAEEVDYVADKMWPYFEKKFQNKQFVLSDRGEVGWIYFFSKVKITTLAEMKAQKMWLWGDDQLVSALFKKIGVTGIPLGVPEVDASLASDRINACYGSPVTAVASQWHTKIKFATRMPLNFGIGATVFAESAYNKISAADRKIVAEIQKAAAKKMRKVVRKANSDALTIITRKGVKVAATPALTVAEYTKGAREIWQTLAGKVYTKDELDTLIRYQTEYRSKKQ